MGEALELTTLAAAGLNVAVAAFLVFELARRRIGYPPIAIVVVAFFLARALERLTEPDGPFPYSIGVDFAVDLLLIVLLLLLAVGARQLADATLATFALARYRIEEYSRARRDYQQLVRHRIANPLTAIRGAAQTLAAGAGDDPALQRRLLEVIIEATTAIEKTSLEPDPATAEEQSLRPTPREPL